MTILRSYSLSLFREKYEQSVQHILYISVLLLAEYTRGAKQVMKAKFVCNIHNVVIFSIATTVIKANTTSTFNNEPKDE